MTTSQSQAVWELCRQGLPLTADEAAERWEKGETYEPELPARMTRVIEHLIERSNWEIQSSLTPQ
jgi:hypothetical protein